MIIIFKAVIIAGIIISILLHIVRRKRLELMEITGYEALNFDNKTAGRELSFLEDNVSYNLNVLFEFLKSAGFDQNIILKPSADKSNDFIFSFLNKNYALYLDVILCRGFVIRFSIFNQFYDSYILLSAWPEDFDFENIKNNWVGFINVKAQLENENSIRNFSGAGDFFNDYSGIDLSKSGAENFTKFVLKFIIAIHVNRVREFSQNGRIPYYSLKYDYYKLKNFIETLKNAVKAGAVPANNNQEICGKL